MALPQQKTDATSIIAFILGVGWLVAVFVFHMGGWVHLLLVVAIILTMAKIAKNPVR